MNNQAAQTMPFPEPEVLLHSPTHGHVYGFTTEQMRAYGDAREAAALSQTAGVPDGWVLVPVEPTAKMQVAGWCAHWEDTKPRDVWAAMLGVLPHPYVAPMPNNADLVNPALDDAWKNIVTRHNLDPINRDVAAVTHALTKVAAAPAASGGEAGHGNPPGEYTNWEKRVWQRGYRAGMDGQQPQPPSGASVSERAMAVPESLRTEIFNAFDDITGLCRHLREGGPVDDDLNGLNEGLQEAIHIAGGMMARMSEPACEYSSADVKQRARELLAEAERGPQNDYGTVHRQIAHRALEQALTQQRGDDVAPGDGHPWGDFSRKDLCELADRLTEGANLRVTRKWPFLKSPGAIANAIDSATRHYPLVGAIRNVLIETDQIYIVPDTTPQPGADAVRAVGWLNSDGNSYLPTEKRARMIEAGKRGGASVGEVTFGKIAEDHRIALYAAPPSVAGLVTAWRDRIEVDPEDPYEHGESDTLMACADELESLLTSPTTGADGVSHG